MRDLDRRVTRLETEGGLRDRVLTVCLYEGETEAEAKARTFGTDEPPPHNLLVVIRKFGARPGRN